MWKDIKKPLKNTSPDYRFRPPEEKELESKKRVIIAILLLVISACLVTAGVTRGEVFVVFTKAVHICLECIGLG